MNRRRASSGLAGERAELRVVLAREQALRRGIKVMSFLY
jgi:hypothetical protein